MSLLAVNFSLVALVLIGPSRNEPLKAEVACLVGTWRCVSGEADGLSAAQTDMRLMLHADGTCRSTRTGSVPVEGTFTVYQGAEAWIINLKARTGPEAGKTLFCIYERKGDELRLCYALVGTDRPTDFTSGSGSRHVLLVYEREGGQ